MARGDDSFFSRLNMSDERLIKYVISMYGGKTVTDVFKLESAAHHELDERNLFNKVIDPNKSDGHKKVIAMSLSAVTNPRVEKHDYSLELSVPKHFVLRGVPETKKVERKKEIREENARRGRFNDKTSLYDYVKKNFSGRTIGDFIAADNYAYQRSLHYKLIPLFVGEGILRRVSDRNTIPSQKTIETVVEPEQKPIRHTHSIEKITDEVPAPPVSQEPITNPVPVYRGRKKSWELTPEQRTSRQERYNQKREETKAEIRKSFFGSHLRDLYRGKGRAMTLYQKALKYGCIEDLVREGVLIKDQGKKS